MKKIFKVSKKILKDPTQVFFYLSTFGVFKNMSDEKWIKTAWKLKTKSDIDLDNPQTFNEKLQWLKLHDRKPEYTTMADKLLAKKYVSERIGDEYIIPTLATWNNPEDINFDELPEQFVLKCNHNSGKGMFICKDKSKIDIKHVKKELKKGMKQNFFIPSREWPYKNITRKILSEKYMEDSSGGGLIDYKFYCFEGEPQFLYVGDANIVNNEKNGMFTFLDLSWNKTEFQRTDHKRINKKINKPLNFNKMVEFSRVLSKNTHFLRVDWYEINGKLYFGEMTFFPGGGFGFFSPEKYEKILGDLIKINN